MKNSMWCELARPVLMDGFSMVSDVTITGLCCLSAVVGHSCILIFLFILTS